MSLKDQILQLSAPVQDKIITLPLGATSAAFTPAEQAEIEAVFGPDWVQQFGLPE